MSRQPTNPARREDNRRYQPSQEDKPKQQHYTSHNSSFGTILPQEEPSYNDGEYGSNNNNNNNNEADPNLKGSDEEQDDSQTVKTDSLKLLVKFVDYLKAKGDSDPNTVLMLQERLIYTSAFLLQKGASIEDLDFDFQSEAIQYVQKINLRAMENGATLGFEELLNLITKAIDMLLYKPVYSRIRPLSKVLELRILCFNNLSCIYRQKKMHQEALQAVECAIQMEEVLNNGDETGGETRKNIASTYINKSVIMSELGMHLESIETIKHALNNMNDFRKQWEANLEEQDAFQLKYLSVIAYFNLAVEHEHLFYLQYAKTFYEIALNLSKELNYTEMTSNIQAALRKIQNTPKHKYQRP